MFYFWLIDEAEWAESKGTENHLIFTFSSVIVFSIRNNKSKKEYDGVPWLLIFLIIQLPFCVLSKLWF